MPFATTLQRTACSSSSLDESRIKNVDNFVIPLNRNNRHVGVGLTINGKVVRDSGFGDVHVAANSDYPLLPALEGCRKRLLHLVNIGLEAGGKVVQRDAVLEGGLAFQLDDVEGRYCAGWCRTDKVDLLLRVGGEDASNFALSDEAGNIGSEELTKM